MSKHQPYPRTPFYDRLTLLSKLEDGWLDGHGKAPSKEALKAASVLGPALPRDVYLYPTEAGGVSLEWDDQHGGHEIEVLPDGHLSLMTVERDTGVTTEPEVSESAEVQRLRRMIRQIMTGNRRHVDRLKAEVAAARQFASEMRDFCSPHGVAVDYADRLIEVMDRAKGAQA